VSDCTFFGTDVGLRFKSTRGRGGVVENILCERIRMTNIPTEAILFDLFYGGQAPTDDDATGSAAPAKPATIPGVSEETPSFRNIVVRDIVCRGARRAALLQGLPEMPLENIRLENLDLVATEGITVADAFGFTLRNVRVQAAHGPGLALREARGIEVTGFVPAVATGPTVTLAGARSQAVSVPGLARDAISVAPEVSPSALVTAAR